MCLICICKNITKDLELGRKNININKLKSLKVAKSKDDDVVCDVMYNSVCDVVCGDVVFDVVCDVVYGDDVW